MTHLLTRHQAPVALHRAALAGLGGAVAIALLGLVAVGTGWPWIAAPLGASCVLVFSLPAAPVSQPVNVVAGHVLSAAVGLAVATVLPVTWWSVALAVGLAIAAMAVLRVTHPPAGANPIVVMTVGAGWAYLVAPVLVGALVVVAVGVVHHRLASRGSAVYPLPAPRGATRG
ncbi:HPP family protein [Sediminihabitans luteus]|uniref:HPP family protein n=1 Tax=Sediminihabitans luteus TaxID=1138585 RepID=A0A2M9CZY5_9CELL|nr:HPP family protein [Sediminihabitans luteus]PJJ77457.1 HPP family protein [Sediminihabitans luteus]GII98350.1 hypothetical protein Slu03_07280 [Sediminihabitans luteus]